MKQVLDEPARERLVLVTGVSRGAVFRQLAMVLLVSSVISAGVLYGLLSGTQEVRRGHVLTAAVYLALVGGWLWRKLSIPDRVVTLSHGRVEVREGAWTQSWSTRDFRFTELAYYFHQTKHLTLHTVRLWLLMDGPDDPKVGLRGGRVELLRYEQEQWLSTHAHQYAQMDGALGRLGLRERLPAPTPDAKPARDARPASADDPPPRLDVELASLEPSLREVLVEEKRLPPGVRLLADRSEGDAGLFIMWLVIALVFALPTVGLVVAAMVENPSSWKLPDDVGNLIFMLLFHAVVGGIALAPVYCAREVHRRRKVDARIRAGQYAQGLYLQPDTLLLSRAGRVMVMPRARVIRFLRSRGEVLSVEYRSAENLREHVLLDGTYPRGGPQGDPFKVLEHWRTEARTTPGVAATR